MTSGVEGRLYTYWPERKLNVFEHLSHNEMSERALSESRSTLLFIAGLGDTFLSVPYVRRIADLLAHHGASSSRWSVLEIQLTSSGPGWGVCDLNKDVEEIAKCVSWLRSGNGSDSKVVLMGHSTGSQDVLHYLYHKQLTTKREAIDGAILQAPVSDREALRKLVEESTRNNYDRNLGELYDTCLKRAKLLRRAPDDVIYHIRDPDVQSDVQRGTKAAGPNELEAELALLPRDLTEKLGYGEAFVSASRFLSLASPDSPEHPSNDDLFSSDLPPGQLDETFGSIGRTGLLRSRSGLSAAGAGDSVLILMSEADEHCPKDVVKLALLGRWKEALEKGGVRLDQNSGVIKDVLHNGESVEGVSSDTRSEVAERCMSYLRQIH